MSYRTKEEVEAIYGADWREHMGSPWADEEEEETITCNCLGSIEWEWVVEWETKVEKSAGVES